MYSGWGLYWDKRRNSGFVHAISNFLDHIGLQSVWDKFPIDFTHLHTDSKSSSILDHFFCNQAFLDKVLDAGPVHLGDNRSRHSPIMMKVDLGDIPNKMQAPEARSCKKPAWYKASDEAINEYTEMLDQRLATLSPPASLSCHDVN